MFYKRPLVLSMLSLLVSSIPATILAGAPENNPEYRPMSPFDRPEMPAWIKERRGEMGTMYQRRFIDPMGQGPIARMAPPVMPTFEAPQAPNWVTDRRNRMPSMPAYDAPQVPEWIADRRTRLPSMSEMPGFEAPQVPEWVIDRRAQMPSMPEIPSFEAPRVPGWVAERPATPEWVKERRAQMPVPGAPIADWAPAPQFAHLQPFTGVPAYVAPGWGAPAWGGPVWGTPWGWPAPPAAAAPATAEERSAEAPEPALAPVVTDNDADGVQNDADMCPGSKAGAPVDVLGCEQDAAIVLRGVNFKTDSDELTEDSVDILDRVAATLVANSDIGVEVSGHTDSDGDAAYNKDLSQRRAETVMAYLAVKGVSADKLSAMGYGEERPMASNESPDGKAQNRRVELNR